MGPPGSARLERGAGAPSAWLPSRGCSRATAAATARARTRLRSRLCGWTYVLVPYEGMVNKLTSLAEHTLISVVVRATTACGLLPTKHLVRSEAPPYRSIPQKESRTLRKAQAAHRDPPTISESAGGVFHTAPPVTPCDRHTL